jgi:hypothetical protein
MIKNYSKLTYKYIYFVFTIISPIKYIFISFMFIYQFYPKLAKSSFRRLHVAKLVEVQFVGPSKFLVGGLELAFSNTYFCRRVPFSSLFRVKIVLSSALTLYIRLSYSMLRTCSRNSCSYSALLSILLSEIMH